MNKSRHTPEALTDLQDSIWREKVARARAMTPDERLLECFRLSDLSMANLLTDALQRMGTDDLELGWKEVRRVVELERLERDKGFFTSTPPTA